MSIYFGYHLHVELYRELHGSLVARCLNLELLRVASHQVDIIRKLPALKT
jgi:hypothetical protein